MAIQYLRNALGATNSATSFSITLPTTAAGDILILEYVHRGTGTGTIGGTSITTGGLTWTEKHSQLFNSSAYSGRTVWTRATGNHSGQTITGSGLTNSCAAIVTVYSGAKATGDPLADATIVGEQNASGNETQAEITTSSNGAWVVLVVVNSPDYAVTSQSCTSPGTLTARAERLSTGGIDTSVAHASAEKATAGATGAFTWAQTNDISGSWAYAITPEPEAIALVPDDSFHANTSDSVTITQTHSITVNDSFHANSSDPVVLTQVHSISLNDSFHSNIVDGSLVLEQIQPAIDLVPQDSFHANSVDSVVITQQHSIVLSDARHDNSSDNVAVTQVHSIIVNDSRHSNTVDPVVLTQVHSVILSDSAHSNTVDSVTITQQHSLQLNDSFHANITENLIVVQEAGVINLLPNDSFHSNSVDSILLTQQHSIVISDLSHNNTVDPVTISQVHNLSISDSRHTTSCDAVSIVQQHNITVSDANHQHSSDNVVVTMYVPPVDLIVDKSYHQNSSDNVTIAIINVLSVNNSYHGNSSDSCEITQDHIISINKSFNNNTVEGVIIVITISEKIIFKAGFSRAPQLDKDGGTAYLMTDNRPDRKDGVKNRYKLISFPDNNWSLEAFMYRVPDFTLATDSYYGPIRTNKEFLKLLGIFIGHSYNLAEYPFPPSYYDTW
jgi:hypothetical protein